METLVKAFSTGVMLPQGVKIGSWRIKKNLSDITMVCGPI